MGRPFCFRCNPNNNVLRMLLIAILTHVAVLMSSMFNIPTDYWISPNVSGDIPPPVRSCTLSKIANEKVLLYGGSTAQGPSSELRVATVFGDSVVSMCVCYVILVSFNNYLHSECFRFCQGMLGEFSKSSIKKYDSTSYLRIGQVLKWPPTHKV